ncbi:DEAD/DEAH box helicase [Micromonospora coxensis]|uniref:DEAD/DEAH box helicase n=1 Tax=Micromonospora coxensis TaxID=356852 RepID=UPI00343701BF
MSTPVLPRAAAATAPPARDRTGDPAGAPVTTGRHAVTFGPADPPRAATLLLWSPDGDAPPAGPGVPVQVSLATPPHGATAQVSARQVPLAQGVALLLAPADAAHPSAVFWAAAAREALHLAARGLLLPDVSPAGHDTWRIGPLDDADTARLRDLAAAMPATARARPLPGRSPARLPDAARLLRDFLDAVADLLPRDDTGDGPWTATHATPVPRLRDWATRVAAHAEAAVRLSLRLEPLGPPDGPWRAVVQLRRRTAAGLLTDAATLFSGPVPGFPAATRDTTLLALRDAAACWPPLAGLLAQPVPDVLTLGDDELADLLGAGGRRLAAAGIDVHWPAGLRRDLTATARLRPPAGVTGLLGDLSELALDWRVALHGTPLTPAELRALTEAHRPVVRLREHWVLVDPDLAARLRRPAPTPLTPVTALRAALTGSLTVDGADVPLAGEGWARQVRDRLTTPTEVAVPAGLAATLRDYQRHALRWLAGLTALGLGGCLADDMGLGKTVTLIALHLHRQADPNTAGPTLVVCPASLLGNWEREIGRFAPGVAVRRHHGPGRTLDGLTGGFVLTTYATLSRDVDVLAGRRWPLLVADEAQHVKNPAAAAARALRAVPAAARVALTGTPVENSLTDLWAVLDWSTPGLLGGLSEFRARWTGPAGAPAHRRAELARLVRPFLLRRRKSDPGIAPELPAKTETDQPVSLTAEQAALYQGAVDELLDTIAGTDGPLRRALVVKLLTALKQICNHPAQYLRESAPRLAGRSGKLDLLDDLLEAILPAGSAVLVFTQYVTMARLLHRHLHERGVESLLLHGGLTPARRDDLVRRFDDGQAPVFLLSLRAAGTGLNLTRADHVMHFDRWWNPAVEDQATDRAYRIGQTRPVQVHRLITEGTVEDRIAALLAGKRDLAAAVLDAGAGGLAALDDAALADLVTLRGPA